MRSRPKPKVSTKISKLPCMMCQKLFKPKGKFNRRCPNCAKNLGKLGKWDRDGGLAPTFPE